MADRVVVLSDRPARVKKVIDVNMEDEDSPVNRRKCDKFSYYYDIVWKEIDKHV